MDDNSNNDKPITSYKYSVSGKLSPSNNNKLSTLSKEERQNYDEHIFNLEFGDAYQHFTLGSPWLTMYPPNPLRHFIWSAEYFGQEHIISTKETHFHTIPPEYVVKDSTISSIKNRRLTIQEMKNPDYDTLNEYRQSGLLNITLKVLSCTPKVFEISNFLSDMEVDHMLSIVNRSTLERSTTNGEISNTRTSRTTWISRSTDGIINSIFRRVADVVQINEALLRHRVHNEIPTVQTLAKINEDIQIVHYDTQQEYTPHHDFGYPKGLQPNDKLDRTLNFAMYLNDVIEGGETSFPRWRNAHTSSALKVKPTKGTGLLFYMTNPDGNLEDMTQHAGLPVIKGEKYFANLWLHTFL